MSSMRAVAIRQPGGPDVLELVTRPRPEPGAGEVLVDVHYAGVNRPDVLQRKGGYPPPPGASDLPGLEVAGVVSALGAGVTRWKEGDKVCALIAGGGYAEYVTVAEGHCLPVPANLSLSDAACLPETVFTVWTNVFERARLQPGETLLVHGGAGGIGTTAIRLAKLKGARVFATAGNAAKARYCTEIGADAAIDYQAEVFESRVAELTGKKGVDVILDVVGAPYLQKNVASLAHGGRLVIIGLQGGRAGEVDLSPVLTKHLTITASTLRPRSIEEKARLAREVETHVWPLVVKGDFKLRVDRIFPLARAADAHKMMEAGEHFGKIALAVKGDAP